MPESPDRQFPEIERLLVELARAYGWIGMYRPGHPALSGRIEPVFRTLAEQVAKEPGGRLLFGVAKDKVLYHDVFLGSGQPLVHRLTEALFLNQVATLEFSSDAGPEGLLALLRLLHESAGGKCAEPLDGRLKALGVRGVGLHPYNYKDVLSRRIVSGGGDLPSPREDALWRMLLTENAGGEGEGEDPLLERLSVSPELLPAILRRAYAASAAGLDFASDADPGRDPVSPDLVRKLMSRLGETVGRLPQDRKAEVLAFIDRGIEQIPGGGEPDAASLEYLLGRALADGRSDDEFLEMLAAFLSAEEKGGRRLRRIFEVIASDRSAEGGLLPRARERVRESRRTKDYFAEKTWELVEGFLLARSEEAYIGEDHGHLLESLSSLGGRNPAPAEPAPAVGAAYAEAFRDEALRRKAVSVLLELLADDAPEDEYAGILEDIRKTIPNLVSRREFDLLRGILSTLSELAGSTSEARKRAIASVIEEMDFAHVVGLFLEPGLVSAERELLREILIAFSAHAIDAILERLLVETSKNVRRTLLQLCARMAPVAVPAIAAQLSDPHWYFQRNLCLILGEIGDPSAAGALVPMLDHRDARVRREAIVALGKLRAQDTVVHLGRILLNESLLPSVREDSLRIDAANAIFRCGGTRAASYLHRGTDCRRAVVRDHCESLLRTMRPS